MTSIAALLQAKPSATVIPAGLSAEEFKDLTLKVEALKVRLMAGESLTLDEERSITVWFRQRRITAYQNATVKKKPSKRVTVRKPKAPKITKEGVQKLMEDLLI